jgi:hypothetical protein
VAYRNRSHDEVRDISIVRKIDGRWLAPQTVYEDQWQIHGCPVNGPVVRTSGSTVAVAWYTMIDTLPEVKLAFSTDHGDHFNPPIRIDMGNPLGRIDMAFSSNDEVLVSWLEQSDSATQIKMIPVKETGAIGDAIDIATTSASRSSGFPRMTFHDGSIIIAWTDIEQGSRIRTQRLQFF